MHEQINFDGFATYLREFRLAEERHIPYLVGWVQRYLRLQVEADLCDEDRLRVYIDSLESDVRLTDWQQRQAENAVRLHWQWRDDSDKRSGKHASALPARSATLAISPAWMKVRQEMVRLVRLRHYSPRTEEAYLGWINRFRQYLGPRSPDEVDGGDMKNFLSHLAVRQRVSASTQNQAFCALLFLLREVIQCPPEGLSSAVRAKRGRRLPVVFSCDEVKRLFGCMDGTTKLMAQLIYGAGLRLMECITLRVKDIDFDRDRIFVRSGKGNKDRSTLLPGSLVGALKEHLNRRSRSTRRLCGALSAHFLFLIVYSQGVPWAGMRMRRWRGGFIVSTGSLPDY